MLADARPGQGDDDDMTLLAQPHLIDFGPPSNHPPASTLLYHPQQSQVLSVISPFRIHPHSQHLTRSLPHQQTSSSAPTSDDDSFDTPLSERRRRRRVEQGKLIASAKARGIFGMGSIDKSTRNAENIGGPVTPSPIRYSGQIRSASKFSSLDEDDEEEGRER